MKHRKTTEPHCGLCICAYVSSGAPTICRHAATNKLAEGMSTHVSTAFETDAQALFEEIIRTSNYFLHNCKHFSISLLQEEDPSYSELAEVMTELAGIIKAIGSSDPMLNSKADDYCDLMTKMAVAIVRDDPVQLSQLVKELERKPGI